jgi:hypothetical protein
MIDTIKVAIPLTKIQHERIVRVADDQDRWQWVQLNPLLGEMRFQRSSGLMQTDSHSYHRELRWDIDYEWSEASKLYLEFSIPKYWYGHNISLLYGYLDALLDLRAKLSQQFKLKGKNALIDPSFWQLCRLDICYGWYFPTQASAQGYLDSLRPLHYPRKRKESHDTSLYFIGATYTLKFYLKHPEFKKHDLGCLVKAGATLEWINHLESLADGVLRFEVTLRSQYLKKHGLKTIADLLEPKREVLWDEAVSSSPDFDEFDAASICYGYTQRDSSVPDELGVFALFPRPDIKDGLSFSAPEGTYLRDGRPYYHSGGGFTFRVQDKMTLLLQEFMNRLLGTEVKMLKVNQVETKLLELYKPVKAARLVSLWLYVQRFGTAKAKDVFGSNSFYRSRREMKAAGVSMAEAQQVITLVDDEFLKNFSPDIPSAYAVNRVDDFRDQQNILNFRPRESVTG